MSVQRKEHIQKCKQRFQSFLEKYPNTWIRYIRKNVHPDRYHYLVAKARLRQLVGLKPEEGGITKETYEAMVKAVARELGSHGTPVGVVVVTGANGKIVAGYSKCCPKDMNNGRWNRYMGIADAISRIDDTNADLAGVVSMIRHGKHSEAAIMLSHVTRDFPEAARSTLAVLLKDLARDPALRDDREPALLTGGSTAGS